MGSGLNSAAIVKDMARSLGRQPARLGMVRRRPKGADRLPVVAAAQVNAVMSDARRPTTAIYARSCIAARPWSRQRWPLPSIMRQRRGGAGGDRHRLRAGGAHHRRMPGFRERGFHGSNAAIFAATGAAGRLLRLDPEQ